MDAAVIDRLVARSRRESDEEEAAAYEVKAYVLMKRERASVPDLFPEIQGFTVSRSGSLPTGEYVVNLNNYEFFVEDSGDTIIAVTVSSTKEAETLERYVEGVNTLSLPWIRGDRLRTAIREF